MPNNQHGPVDLNDNIERGTSRNPNMAPPPSAPVSTVLAHPTAIVRCQISVSRVVSMDLLWLIVVRLTVPSFEACNRSYPKKTDRKWLCLTLVQRKRMIRNFPNAEIWELDLNLLTGKKYITYEVISCRSKEITYPYEDLWVLWIFFRCLKHHNHLQQVFRRFED